MPRREEQNKQADKVTGKACCLVRELVKCNLKSNAATANFCFGSAKYIRRAHSATSLIHLYGVYSKQPFTGVCYNSDISLGMSVLQ
jgi:esterase/lipase superfamily enzyme